MRKLTEEEKLLIPNPFKDMTEAQWQKTYNGYVSYLVSKDMVISMSCTKKGGPWIVAKRKLYWLNDDIPSGYEDLSAKCYSNYKEAMEETRHQVSFLINLYNVNEIKPTVDYSIF